MKAANLFPYEKVDVNNSSNSKRITTYVIPGKPHSGEIKMNGGASLHASIGDEIHVLSYCEVDESKAKTFKPTIVHTDFNNKLINPNTT
jgi:aspartate 1-decarboxylase